MEPDDRVDTGGVVEMSEVVMHAEDVHKRFGRLEVLKGISLEVTKGETICIIGPSGSGKTTFLRCINHLEKIDSGRIEVNGQLIGYRQRGDRLVEDSERNIARQRTQIGMVFQRFNLFPHKTALQNVTEGPIQVLDVMKGLATDFQTTMIVVTHEMGFARKAANRVVMMDDGLMIEEGTPEHFFVEPTHERTKQFLSKIL